MPHIGHAYEVIATDAMARFKRLDGYDVFFMTGTDEHGLKMQQTAEKEGITAKELADRNSAAFRQMSDDLGISLSRFIRTTDADHYEAAKAIWERMEANGDIYLSKYAGWYSVRDERYYVEDETEVQADGLRYASETGTEVTWTEEESYFFKLSAYQDRLLALYADHPDFGAPHNRFNEVISFVKGGLEDLSISRTSFDWGVPVPGNPDHVMYVWVDALTNYLTGVGFPDTESEPFRKYWPADVHVIGKDISRFHAVYWPAFLMSAGLELPKRVMIHGFLHNQGVKMSKSLGNVVAPADWVAQYGLDQVRFFLLREVPFGADGSYSHDAIVGRMNADLANNFGNLAQRSLSMVAKNCDGRVPVPGGVHRRGRRAAGPGQRAAGHLPRRVREAGVQPRPRGDLGRPGRHQRLLRRAGPWVLRKTDVERMNTVLYVTLEVLRIVAILAQPVMPAATAAILDTLGQPEGEARAVRRPGHADRGRNRAARARPRCSRSTRSPPRRNRPDAPPRRTSRPCPRWHRREVSPRRR